MLKKLRLKFIALNMVTVAAVIIVVFSAVVAINYQQSLTAVREAMETSINDAAFHQSPSDAQAPVSLFNADAEVGAVFQFICPSDGIYACYADYPVIHHRQEFRHIRALQLGLHEFRLILHRILDLVGILQKVVRLFMCQDEIVQSPLTVFFSSAPYDAFSSILKLYFLIVFHYFYP